MRVVEHYLAELQDLLGRVPRDGIEEVLQVLIAAYRRGSHLYFIGNGGSAATAAHFVCDLTKNTTQDGGRRFRAFALTDNVPLLTAWSNDTTYENAFAGQLTGLIEPDDVLVMISGSGQSPNILQAALAGRAAGAVTVGLTGFEGGQLKDLVDICVIVPSNRMEQIEDVHLALEHALCSALRQMVGEVVLLRTLDDRWGRAGSSAQADHAKRPYADIG